MMCESTFDKLQAQALHCAKALAVLNEKMQAAKEQIDKVQERYAPDIKRFAELAAVSVSLLEEVIAENPQLFVRPKTVTLYGMRCGYAKSKTSVDFEDADEVVARIKKYLPEHAAVLIRSKETPVREALAQLPPSALKKLGVTLVGGEDVVVARPVDGQIDKSVVALLQTLGSQQVASGDK